MYLTQTAAEEALIAAWNTYAYKGTSGPRAFYFCDSCGFYHLTSKGEMNERLARELDSGKIQRQEEADQWIQKLKRKS
jgi:hypothetical protein